MARHARISLRGAVLVFIVGVSSVLCLAPMLTPGFLVVLFSLPLYTYCNEIAVASWLGLMLSLLELVFRVKVKISGDHRRIRGPCIIILNHRTRFDWLFLWCYLFRLGEITKLKIILKDSIKKVPMFSWGMQAAQFLFISRNWSRDEKAIAESIAYFRSNRSPVQILIFPEGTDLSESNKVKSQEFAEQNGLQKYEYVLHPRTRGFIHCFQELQKGKVQVTLLNLSIGYVGGIPQNESDLVAGNLPKELHFHGQVVSPSELPKDKVGLEEWLKERWQEKEAQLERFYARGHFEGPYMEDKAVYHPVIVAKMTALLVFWFLFLSFFGYAIIQFSLVQWYYLITFAVLWSLTYFTGGTDSLTLRYHQWKQGRH